MDIEYMAVSYTHLRAHETLRHLVCRLLLEKKFITVIPDDKIDDIKYIESQIKSNRDFSIQHRHDILEYAHQFDWDNIIEKYYIPSINEIKTQNVPSTT